MRRTSEEAKDLFSLATAPSCTDMQEVLTMAKKLSRKRETEYRFLEESKENVHLYEKMMIDNERTQEFRDVL
jgi:hypothetical protein